VSEVENVVQMRETIERLSKDKAGLEKQVTEQTVQLRNFSAMDAFREAGYNPNHGKLYAAVNPEGEITAEAVVAFANEQSLAPVASSTQEETSEGQESTPGEAEEQSKLAAMASGGSRVGDPASGGAEVQTLTRQQWQELHATDPTAARAAVASGRVQISKDNVFSGQSLAAGVNPFVPTPTDS
jgi:hypothetical protein